ncbi:MAG: CRISPR-associated ring nuclease [Thermoflexales bacterium]|nr:CRISPR-associated ring nuclease [Thermoflexales bacterium]
MPTEHDPSPRVALIATLGGKPQVVTFALDELLLRQTPIQRVYALHLAPTDPALQRSLDRLRQAFEQRSAYHAIKLDSVTIREHPPDALERGAIAGRAIERVDDPAAPDAIWLAAQRLITTLKDEGFAIVLLLAGGPRLIALQALAAASVLLDNQDQCLHLYTPPELRQRAGYGEVMHRNPTDPPVRLVRVPLFPTVLIAPWLREAAWRSPHEVLLAARQRPPSRHDVACAQVVLNRLSPAQRDVLREIVRPDADRKSVCRALHITSHTLDSHIKAIYRECRTAWGLAGDQRLSLRFLHEKFSALLG